MHQHATASHPIGRQDRGIFFRAAGHFLPHPAVPPPELSAYEPDMLRTIEAADSAPHDPGIFLPGHFQQLSDEAWLDHGVIIQQQDVFHTFGQSILDSDVVPPCKSNVCTGLEKNQLAGNRYARKLSGTSFPHVRSLPL